MPEVPASAAILRERQWLNGRSEIGGKGGRIANLPESWKWVLCEMLDERRAPTGTEARSVSLALELAYVPSPYT